MGGCLAAVFSVKAVATQASVASPMEALQSCSRRIARIRKQLKRNVAAAKLRKERLYAQTLLVYTWSNYTFAAAAHFLQKRSDVPLEDPEAEVAEMYTSCSAAKLVEVAIEPERREVAKIAKFLVEYKLWLFCKELNAKGLVPSRVHLMRRAVREIPQGIPQEAFQQVACHFVGSPRKQRKWLYQWRRDWNLWIGKLRVLPCISAPELHEKAW